MAYTKVQLLALAEGEDGANDGGLQLSVPLVGWDDSAATGNLRAHVLWVHALTGGHVQHLLRDLSLLGVVHLREHLVPTGLAAGNPGGTDLGQALAGVHALRPRGIIGVVVVAICEVDAPEWHPQHLPSGLVHHFACHLHAVGVELLQCGHIPELQLLSVLAPVHALLGHLGGGQGLELLERVRLRLGILLLGSSDAQGSRGVTTSGPAGHDPIGGKRAGHGCCALVAQSLHRSGVDGSHDTSWEILIHWPSFLKIVRLSDCYQEAGGTDQTVFGR
mmetsp:Transcript_27052/g.69710  ORF Transcript_27052/g.69710 Transcript_27052/m.69710 type:complete len:276 (-) Transcript_27052:40-867(-)